MVHSAEAAQKLAAEFSIPYVETSAKADINISEVRFAASLCATLSRLVSCHGVARGLPLRRTWAALDKFRPSNAAFFGEPAKPSTTHSAGLWLESYVRVQTGRRDPRANGGIAGFRDTSVVD